MIDPDFMLRHAVTTPPPAPSRDWALFLDLDGTLLDIAPTPDAVTVPDGLVDDLAAAGKALDGALAIVSGRSVDDIDRLLSPLHLPAGGEHGAVIRLPDGRRDEVEIKVPEDWRRALGELAATSPGVLIEIKRHNVVAHYRNAPSYAAKIAGCMRALVARDPDNFERLEAKMAFEIRPRKVTKARVVAAMMDISPFRSRIPVFIGDDRTDEDGFAEALARGGIALDVGISFGGHPSKVREWLKRIAKL